MLSAADSRVLSATAVAELIRGRAAQAVDLFTRCLRLEPGSAQIHLLRGYAFADQQRWPQAIADYTKVALGRPPTLSLNRPIAQSLALEPRNVVGLLAKAYALFQTSKFQSSVLDYTGVLEIEPGNLMALANRGAINELRLNGIPSGIDDLDLAESLDATGFRVALLKAMAFRRRNLVAQSLEQFHHVLQRCRASDLLSADDLGIVHNCMGVMLARQASSESGDAGNEKARLAGLRNALVHFQKAAHRPSICSIAMQNAGQILARFPH